MSGEAEGWTLDPVELGRRIVFAFSAGELQKFAEKLGVGAQVRWDRGHAEAARDVVRQFEKSYGGLPTLVDKLRTAKPLVEWPEPGPPPSQAVPSRRPDPTTAAAAVPHPFAAAPPLASPGSLGGAPGPTIPGAPAFAEAPVSAAPPINLEPAPPSTPAPQPPAAPAPYAPPPGGFAPPGGWPGTVAPANERGPSAGLDPRILIAVAGLMVVAAVIAYFAGRAGSASATPTAAADASAIATAAPARRPDGPATRLASEVDRGVANIARACEVPNGSASEVFARSFEQCGPSDPQRPTPHRTSPLPTPRETAAPREQRVRPAGPDRPRDPPGAACTKACAAETAACRGRCGPEPSEASRYGTYQACMGRCISQASKCKLSCP